MKTSLKYLLIVLSGFASAVTAQTVTIEGTIRVDRNWTETSSSIVLGEDGSTGVESKVVFEGLNQSILTSSASSIYFNLEVNKTAVTAPARYLRLATDAVVQNQVALTAGVVNLNSKALSVSNSASSGISFLSGTGFLAETASWDVDPLGGTPGLGYGYLKWNIRNATGNYVVPFVTSSGADVKLEYNISVAGNIAGQVNFSTYGTPNNNKPWAAGVSQFDAGGADGSAKVANRYYIVEQGSYSTKPKGWLTFKYLTSELDAGLIESRLAAQRFNTSRSSWGDWLYSPAANTAAKTVSIFMANTPDYYDAWVLSDQNTPLPIELVDFEAKAKADYVSLNWTTASEVNSDYFTIQKTQDGINFVDVANVDAAGFSNNYLSYTAIDSSPWSGLSYYRLKNTDQDGQFEVSELKPIFFSQQIVQSAEINVFPNPNNGNGFSVELKGFENDGQLSLQILDLSGRVLYRDTKIIANEMLAYKGLQLAKGVYFLSISNSITTLSKKMLVE